MKGYTIQNSINLLEKNATGGGSGGSTSAANVTFDNTGTGLVSTNVQAAISEVAAGKSYSTTEIKVGKLGDKDLFAKIVDFGALPDRTTKSVAHGITNVDMIFLHSFTAKNTTSNLMIFLPYATSTAQDQMQVYADATNIIVKTESAAAAFDESTAILLYTKVASEAKKTRKK